MNPHLSKNDKAMFYKYLDNCTVYFEYGSGGSTYQASIRKNIKTIYSVESDITWQKKLKQTIENPNINFIYNEMDTKPNTWGRPGKNATNRQKANYSDHIRSISNNSNKIAFVRGSPEAFDETMSGFGGTQLCALCIAKELAKEYDVYVVHDKRENNFVGKSGIKYVKKINEENFRVIIDLRFARNTFIKNVKYIHWIHDPHRPNKYKSDPRLLKYDHVISLTNIQKALWDKTINTANFEVINNPFTLESVEKKENYEKYKIVAFSSKTNWGKCLNIVNELRKIDKRFTLHICSPSYSDVSRKLIGYDYVVNHGCLSHNKMMELLSDSFVCLYPTRFQESFGCVCYECMYYGVPMLTEYVEGSGLNEIIPKNLILPRGCNENLYVDKISEWYRNDTRPELTWNDRNGEIHKQWEQLIKNDKAEDVDLVFIDGRFRVACCLKCYDVIKDDCLIAFDDFLNRPHYHVVLEYFDIIEKTQDNVMVILRKKKDRNIPKKLIKEYEQNPN